MRNITNIDLQDFGVYPCSFFEWFARQAMASSWHCHDYREYGEGTDFESALDDLLHKLATRGFDVGHVEVKWQSGTVSGTFSGGLEGLIKILWVPNEDEGDGETQKYYLGLNFNSTEACMTIDWQVREALNGRR